MPVCAGLYYSEYRPGKDPREAREESPRPVVVLVHGAGSSHLFWPVELRRLPGFRVLAVDLPGHGKSEGIVFQSVEDHSLALCNFLRELGIFSVILVGHSLGAAVALDFAGRNPDQVAALALLSFAARLPVSADLLHAASDPDTYHVALSILRQRFFSPRTLPASVAGWMKPLENQRNTLLFSDLLAASRVDFTGGLGIGSIPCWVACGRDDLITPSSQARALSEGAQVSVFEEIPSAGHFLPLEQPSRLTLGLQAFLYDHLSFDLASPEPKSAVPGMDLTHSFVVQ